MSAASGKSGLWPPAVGAVLCAVFAGARLWRPGPWLIGSPGAEVYGHAWVQGWVAEAWPSLPSETAALDPSAPTAWRVIDPAITWFAAGLARVVGPVGAWNTTALLAVAGAFLGGWFLASRVGGDRWTGALTLALAPAFAGVLTSGLTEDWALGLLAVALALVSRMETPRSAVLAGLAVGSLAWTGLYLALMGALGAAVLALPQLRSRAREVALAASIALLVAIPAALLQGSRLEGDTHRSGVPVERAEPHWRVNPHHGADLASFVAPGPDPVDDGALIRVHPGYLGLSVLILAALAPRGRAWWGVAALALLLAPGPAFRWAGEPLGIPNPAVSLASALPLVGLVNHWGRLVLLAMVGLSASASLGAARFVGWRGWIAAAVLLDFTLLSPRPYPLPVAVGSVPQIVTRLGALPAGALVVVPSAGPGVAFQRILYEQRGHGRPVMVSPNRPGYGAAEGVPLVRWFAGLPGERRDPPDPEVELSLRRLERLGVGAIVVRDPYVADVEALLGAPDVRAADGAAWAVSGRSRPPGTAPRP